jgi:hypothetical protein
MDTQQLKQLAGRLRALLEEASIVIGHSEALDLSASLVGLRNWPEVQAFPQRVRSQDFDLSAASRLAYRLVRKHSHEISPPTLLQLLLPPADRTYSTAPHIWPSGPRPGIYLTTSQVAINSLIAQYEEATDGALIYAERAGNHHDGAIDLGEYGLWSSGLNRVPSGTLLVLGPIELDQQSWSNASDRVIMACLHASNSGHRVAVLFDTPNPEQLAADITLMVAKGNDNLSEEIVGMVLEDGCLQLGVNAAYGGLSRPSTVANTGALPPLVIQQLVATLKKRTTGILAMGSMTNLENPGSDVAEAGLALTDHFGPAARIMPRHRGTMSKFDQVPAAVGQLPFLPSVESAHAQGYRRFLIDPRHTKSEAINPFLEDSLFIACTYACTVEELALCTATSRGRDPSILPWLIAAIAVTPLQIHTRTELLTDLYIGSQDAYVEDSEKVYDFVSRHRALLVEEQFQLLIQSGEIDIDAAHVAGADDRTLKRLTRLLDTASTTPR